jgi:nucleoside-diphosphate kinase
LCIIKPDAVKNGFENEINQKITASGLEIVKSKKISLSEEIAKNFYNEHASKPFFSELVEFIISGEVIIQVLQGENAIKSYRALMGATNPEEAEEGTLRKLFAESLSRNAVHGSDSQESAVREIAIMSDLF